MHYNDEKRAASHENIDIYRNQGILNLTIYRYIGQKHKDYYENTPSHEAAVKNYAGGNLYEADAHEAS